MPTHIADERAVFRILVIGASYAGLAATLNLLDLCNGQPCRFPTPNPPVDVISMVPVHITLVDERDGYYHLIGSPLAFASVNYATKVWKRYEDISALQTPAVQFIQGSVKYVDCQGKKATIIENWNEEKLTVCYDYMIAATGLRRAWPTVPRALRRKEYLLEMATHVHATESATDIIVIGGGAVGVEMAAELKLVQPESTVTLVHSKTQLLSSEPLPDIAKERTMSLMHEAGVRTVMGVRVTKVLRRETHQPGSTEYQVTLSDGRDIKAGFVINAVSKFAPTTSYLPIDVLDEDGYVKIKPNLEFSGDFPNASCHYAAGDVASWSGIKRCGAAMHQGHYTAINIYQKMLEDLHGTACQFLEVDLNVAPMIGLAVGQKALSYSPTEGVRAGEDVMRQFFGDDLGYSICWNYMRLGELRAGQK